MEPTLAQLISSIPDPSTKQALRRILNALADRMSTVMQNTAGLVIKAGSSALVKTGAAACFLLVDGRLATIAAATDLPALAGTVVNATFNVYVYLQNAAGTRSTVMGTAGATLAAVKFPLIPEKSCIIGYTIINPTGTGDFVGGTTALDDATVIPGAVHISTTFPFDPTILLG